ncbi:MAG TPA: hypothetical protein VNW92_11580 [Polyangiaceae bacterium]|jgi:hypothetical protein|nr:hypothetical protein [Polyangiaceae bacterium]
MGCKIVGRSRLAAWLVAVWIFFGASHVQAQSGPSWPTVTLAANVTHSIARDDFRTNDQINLGDCLKDDRLDFTLTLTNRGNYALEVWSGYSCDTLAQRTTLGSSLCWLLYRGVPNDDVPSVPIPVRSILAGYASSFATPTGTLVQAGPEACVPPNTGISAASQARIYFMLVDSSTESTVGVMATWNARYKLTGPNPPDEVTAAPAAKSLVVSFGYSGGFSADQTINSYSFFCDPPPGPAVPADTGSDASAPLTCDESPISAVLVQGSISVDPLYHCGTAKLDATSGTATGLDELVPHHVAVAATDTYGNVGPLSMVACAVPAPDAGQSVSACCFSPRRVAPRSSLLLLSLTLALSIFRRRTRSGGSRRPTGRSGRARATAPRS